MEIKNTPLILKELESRAGCRIELEPLYKMAGRIFFPDGGFFYFKNTSIDINAHGASEIAKDKGYTRFFMDKMGYKIARGGSFFSDHWCQVNGTKNDSKEAIRFAYSIGYPIVIKPNSGSKGRDVFKIYSEKQLLEFLPKMFERHNVIILEEYVLGSDYRLVVLRDRVMIAYQRSPLMIIGTGKDDIEALIEIKQQKLFNAGRILKINPSDPRITERLRSFYNIDVSFIPKEGEEIVLLDNANLSSGGEMRDVTEEIHESYKAAAIRLSHDLGLDFAGIDLITTSDISKPMNQETVFIEINSSPGLIHYRSLNSKAKERVQELYLSILSALKNRLR